MKKTVWLAAVAVLALTAGAARPQAQAPLPGYLPAADVPSSLTLIPPPPAAGSNGQARDDDASKAGLALHGKSRWDQATLDAALSFPKAAETFSCAVGVRITETDTPRLYTLLRRTLLDVGRSTSPTKMLYKRARPFTVNGAPQCTPEIDAVLRGDGSYPSGHSAIGWGWALILAEAAPERTDAILARGRAFSQSRVVCNVHWRSDTEEGRMMGSAVVARLHTNQAFTEDLKAARDEIAAARAKGLAPTRDCAAEAKALADG